MELSNVTKMPPQRLMLIVGGGVAAGLLWRRFSSNRGSGTDPNVTVNDDGTLAYLDQYPLATEGNLSNNRRDLVANGTIPLPATDQDGNVLGAGENRPDDYYVGRSQPTDTQNINMRDTVTGITTTPPVQSFTQTNARRRQLK